MTNKFLTIPYYIFTLLLLTNSLSAQESEKYGKFRNNVNYREGYILNKDSIKVSGLFKDKLKNYYSKLHFVYQDGTKKKLKPTDIRGFGTPLYFYLSDGESFYKIVTKGKRVNLYSKATKHKSTVDGYYDIDRENFYVQKPFENAFTLVRKKNFSKEFSNYFSDCETLKVKIASKQLTHKDIEAIVNNYNKCK